MVPSDPEVEKQASEEPAQGHKLQSWQCLVSYLCFYGFMAQMRPGESFITPYLLGPDKNFTKEQVTNEITPVLSYAYLAVLVPVFLLTDYLRYKPVLLLQALSYICVWVLLLLGRSVLHMQLMEVCFSITMAARIAYSSYIFSLVRPALYQRMASYSRAAVLLGVFTSSMLGQLLVTVGHVTFSLLNYISLAFLVFSLGLTVFLKRPKRSLFFNRSVLAHRAAPCELDQMYPRAHPPPGRLGRALGACRDSFLVRMLGELGRSVRRPQLRLWCLWWIFNSAGYYLVIYYVHILWNVVRPVSSGGQVYNGAADAASTLLSAIMSFSAGFLKIRWALWAKLVIAGVTAVQAGLVYFLSVTDNIWVCYVAFVLFRGAYQFLVPIATFQIASSLSKELCALVFGINTFLATILKTSITLVVADKRGLGLEVRLQFFVYFVYFLVLSVTYLAGAVLDSLQTCQWCPPQLLSCLQCWPQGQRGCHLPLPQAQELGSPMEKNPHTVSVQDRSQGGVQPPAGSLPPDSSTKDSSEASEHQDEAWPGHPVRPGPAQPADM
ncbi:reduced folate transporter [Thomomys bottae]